MIIAKVIQIVAVPGELIALTEDGHLFRLVTENHPA
jgi:hypothetical protein